MCSLLHERYRRHQMDNFTDQEDVGTPAQHSAPQVESPDTSPAPDATPRPETAPSVQRHSRLGKVIMPSQVPGASSPNSVQA